MVKVDLTHLVQEDQIDFSTPLSKAGFKFEKFNLFNEEISKLPANATLILISPEKNLLKGEIKKLYIIYRFGN